MSGFIVTGRVTKYYLTNDGPFEPMTLHERTETGVFTITVRDGVGGQDWIYLDGGPCSMPVDRLAGAANLGWHVQSGTPPVCIDGEWGGRNYPRIYIPAEQVAKIKSWYDSRLTAEGLIEYVMGILPTDEFDYEGVEEELRYRVTRICNG